MRTVVVPGGYGNFGKRIVDDDSISPEFKELMRIWALLGVLAFSAILMLFWLMVFKPFQAT